MQIGQYKVIDEIGGGGMGRVRLARDAAGRLVVLKNALRDHPDDDERLRDEARVGRFVRHPGLVDTIELIHIADGNNKQRPVLVTAFVPGVSLLELRNVGPLPPAVVCQIGRELGLAIDALHHAIDNTGAPLGIIHRDVTAGNCLLGHDGHARLIDLGIASSKENRALRTEAGLLRGTLRYLAPELFDGGRYTACSDLWALGVVLWEALLGRSAVLGSDAAAVGRICAGSIMILEDNEAPDPRVSQAIAQLLHKDPSKRPQRGNDVAALFAAVERSLAVDGTAEMRRVVAAAISGVPLAPAIAAPIPPQASTADIQVPVLSSSSSVKPPPLPPSATFVARGLSEYAAQLSSMEQAHASAWDSHSDIERRRLATLPVVTGRLLVEDADGWLVEGATVELPMPPEFPMPPTTSARAIAAAARVRRNQQVD